MVPVVVARQGPGGWIEMMARLGRVELPSRPGRNWNVSMATRPPGVSMVVRAQAIRQGGPGGMLNGIPKASVLGVLGARWTVTTFVALVVTVTMPSGVCTASG